MILDLVRWTRLCILNLVTILSCALSVFTVSDTLASCEPEDGVWSSRRHRITRCAITEDGRWQLPRPLSLILKSVTSFRMSVEPRRIPLGCSNLTMVEVCSFFNIRHKTPCFCSIVEACLFESFTTLKSVVLRECCARGSHYTTICREASQNWCMLTTWPPICCETQEQFVINTASVR